MKSNIVRGGGGRIVELRGEIGLKCSKIAVSQHFCRPLSEDEKPLFKGNDTLRDLDTKTRRSN